MSLFRSPHVYLIALTALVGCNTGDEVDSPAQLDVEPSVQFVSFEKIELGQTTTQTITITNSGGSPAKITDAQIVEGDDDTEKELKEGAGWKTEWTLAPGQKAAFTIEWSPENKTDDSGQLVLKTDDGKRPTITIDLDTPEPIGDALSLSVDPAIVDFGVAGPGSVVERVVKISIAGDEKVKVMGARFDATPSADELSIKTQPEWPKEYVKGDSFEVTLVYSPTDLTEDKGDFVIIYDGGEINVPFTATLSPLVYEPVVDFGPKEKNQVFEQVIYLENKSDAVWTLGEAFVKYDKGDGAFDYSFPTPGEEADPTKDRAKGMLPFEIEVNGTLPIRVLFTPGDSVDYSAMLKIAGPVEPKAVDIQLKGSGM